MEAQRTERLGELMSAMASGDVQAPFAMAREYEGSIASVVRRALLRRGASCRREEVASLVIDVCLMLFDSAPGWSPAGGAMPWIWAEKRVGNLVDRHLGQFAVPLDHVQVEADRHAAPRGALGSADEPPVLEVLDQLGSTDPEVRLLQEALGTVASPRDGELFLELRVQELLGDRSPAVTVGALLGLRPDAVRQQHRRVRLRLRRLVESDARFAALSHLPLVA